MNLEALKSHLFETIEGLKNLSDPEADDNEKVRIDQAKAIVDAAGKVIDIYKLQVDAVKTFVSKDDIMNASVMLNDMGVVEEENVKLLQ